MPVSTVASPRTQPVSPEVPNPAVSPAPAVLPPAGTAPAPESTWGDRVALLVWVTCALLLGVLLLKDLLGSLVGLR
jgi:hypothetical protein